VARTALKAARREGDDRDQPVAVRDGEGAVIDEVEPVDSADPVGCKDEEVIDADLRAFGPWAHLNAQDKTPPPPKPGDGQQPAVGRKTDVFATSEVGDRLAYCVA
jgi:hypothetical protein